MADQLLCPHCNGVVGTISRAALTDEQLTEAVRAYLADNPTAGIQEVRAAVGGKLSRVQDALRAVRAAAPPRAAVGPEHMERMAPIPPAPPPKSEPPATRCARCAKFIEGVPVPVTVSGNAIPFAYCRDCAKTVPDRKRGRPKGARTGTTRPRSDAEIHTSYTPVAEYDFAAMTWDESAEAASDDWGGWGATQ